MTQPQASSLTGSTRPGSVPALAAPDGARKDCAMATEVPAPMTSWSRRLSNAESRQALRGGAQP